MCFGLAVHHASSHVYLCISEVVVVGHNTYARRQPHGQCEAAAAKVVIALAPVRYRRDNYCRASIAVDPCICVSSLPDCSVIDYQVPAIVRALLLLHTWPSGVAGRPLALSPFPAAAGGRCRVDAPSDTHAPEFHMLCPRAM